ncbi:Cell division control protein 45 -like protein [Toxocara canis]|uniref:Cell division control protein 45-like protein n=1 Tax=Toxocara canis TaxID=6265 RepID=A0A0B2VM21_TOXCA|nr:Cell division control protein 45 -like protein [Toxocara canis]
MKKEGGGGGGCLVNSDVDALCAVRILMHLFACDDVAYSLVVVNGWDSLVRAVDEHAEQSHIAVLINCGANRALTSLDLAPDMKLYIIDSRRPLHLDNVYAQDNVYILVNSTELAELKCPQASEIFESDSESSDGEHEEGEGNRALEDIEKRAIRRTRRQQWRAKRNDLLWDYYENSWYSISVYAQDNIYILVNSTELAELKCPQASEIFESDSESSDGEHEEGEGNRALEDIEKRAIRRTRRQQWRAKRNDLLWDYYENSWYSISSAVQMLELAHLMGKSSAETMWCAVVGLNSQLVDRLISFEAYTAVCIDRLRPFIRRYSSRNGAMKGDDVLRISFDKELIIPMYAHWSLYKSMINDEYFFCRSQLWQQRGDAKMRSLLATLGLTLTECKQMYSALSQERKKEVFDILQKEINSSFASFTAIARGCNRFNACDFARALCVRLEVEQSNGESVHDRFSASMHILRSFLDGSDDLTPLKKAIECYKSCLESIVSQLFMVINQSVVLSSGPFFLLSLSQSEGTRLLTSRHCLFTFAKFALKAFCTKSRLRNRSSRPLIIAVPMSGENSGWCLVTGVMPFGTEYVDYNHKSFIGRAFERVIERTASSTAKRDAFDSTVIMLRVEEKSRFFDGLQAIMEIA